MGAGQVAGAAPILVGVVFFLSVAERPADADGLPHSSVRG